MNPGKTDNNEVFDMDKFLRDIKINMSPSTVGITILVLLLLVMFIFGGPIYIVGPDEEGVVQTFGKYTSSNSPGLHFKFPWPIQAVKLPKVTEVKRIEVGFKTVSQGPPAVYRDADNDPRMLREAQMLTGDENVVNNSMIVQYKIRDSIAYLFNIEDPEGTLHDLAEAAERQTVGNRPIDDTLTGGKMEIQLEIAEKMQAMADLYGVGVQIIAVQLQAVQPPREVADAFKDVAAAKEDRSRIINISLGYQNEEIPKARGNAAKLLREAEGYERERVARAEGDASRFLALAHEYEKAPSITKKRLYLETMKSVLPRFRKVILDENANIVNLNQLVSPGKGEKK